MSKRDPTRVALVCLKTAKNTSITNQSLFKVFGAHGAISKVFDLLIKILIFEQGALQTKVFIEYKDSESALSAIKYQNSNRSSLNNTKILNNVLCNVYHSRLKELKLDNVPHTKGMDFTQKYTIPSLWDLDTSDDEVVQQVSEEKLNDIRNKLSLIDDEISETIETKYSSALLKLHQQTKCLCFGGVGSLEDVLNLGSQFGQIVYLKQTPSEVYVKFNTDNECQRAYEQLKDRMQVQIRYNFESIPGRVVENSIC